VLPGELTIPSGARGVVVFAHGSGSSRLSPCNRLVAAGLRDAGFATLLMDLLDEPEARNHQTVFDEEMLAERLGAAVRWIGAEPAAHSLPLGYFGESTGAAAALIAAAREPDRVRAVVSRGGRPDMASSWLHLVRAPTLLLVGGMDDLVLRWNQLAYPRIRSEKALIVVTGATHLFEERGALEEVTNLARRWFVRHLLRGDAARDPEGRQ
jgi:pimeloyl-ACP methyl ester carboxylesterase